VPWLYNNPFSLSTTNNFNFPKLLQKYFNGFYAQKPQKQTFCNKIKAEKFSLLSFFFHSNLTEILGYFIQLSEMPLQKQKNQKRKTSKETIKRFARQISIQSTEQ
jgi:hypothetical protein